MDPAGPALKIQHFATMPMYGHDLLRDVPPQHVAINAVGQRGSARHIDFTGLSGDVARYRQFCYAAFLRRGGHHRHGAECDARKDAAKFLPSRCHRHRRW